MKHVLIFFCLLFSYNTSATVTQWTPFEDHGGHIKIPVAVSGVEGFAILDTGANLSAINRSFLLKNSLTFDKGSEMRIKGIHGETKVRLLKNIEVTMFGSPINFKNMAPLSLGNHKNIVLLGAEFFRLFVMQVDYPNKRLRLLTRDSIDLEKHQNVKMRIDRERGMPIAHVELGNGRTLKLLLDTGNNGGIILPRKVAKRHDLLDKYPQRKALSSGIAKTVEMDIFALPELTFGPFTMGNVAMAVPVEGSRSKIFDKIERTGTRIIKQPPDGILGYDVLKHFVLTIDYKKGRMHVGVPQE